MSSKTLSVQPNSATIRLTTTDMHRLSPADDRLLEHLARLSAATAEMLNRCLYAKGSLTTTQEMLYRLFKNGYVLRTNWKRFDSGNSKVIHRLSGRAIRRLRKAGTSNLIRPSEFNPTGRYPLDHLMLSTEILTQAIELTKHSNIRVEIQSEPVLKRLPLYLGELAIIPDSWLRFSRKEKEAVFCLEVDRGTETRDDIDGKVSAYLAADGSDEYRERFGTDRLVVVFASENPARLVELGAWVSRKLHAIKRADALDLFAFAQIRPDFFFSNGLLSEVWA